MNRQRWLLLLAAAAVVLVAVVVWLVWGGGSDEVAAPTASPAASATASPAGAASPSASPAPGPAAPDPQQQALAAVLVAADVPPAPPGTAVVFDAGPMATTPEVPTVQMESCSSLLPAEEPGPPEPDALAAAATSFVTGVAQVDQMVVVYRDDAAAAAAVERHRALAQDCEAALQARVTADSLGAQATVTDPPAGVDGYRVQVAFSYPAGPSDEASSVLRSGAVVAFTRTNETGAPTGSGWETDGVLDPPWVDELMTAAAAKVAAAGAPS